MKPSKRSEPRAARDIVADVTAHIPMRETPAGASTWELFERCEQHGRYRVNTLDKDGTVRFIQPGCPACRKQETARGLLAKAELSPRFAHCTFDNYRVDGDSQRHALETCRAYAEDFERRRANGVCMILRGNPGTGKNHLSTAIMLRAMADGYSALRVKAAAYLDEYWAKGFAEREQWLSRMARVDLLVMDEVGRASNTKNANDAFFRLLDERYENVRPTILISNLDRTSLRETLGPAAYDRLTEGGGNLINFDWASERARAM